MTRRLPVAACALLLTLTACGGGSETPSRASATQPTQAASQPAPGTPTGTALPETQAPTTTAPDAPAPGPPSAAPAAPAAPAPGPGSPRAAAAPPAAAPPAAAPPAGTRSTAAPTGTAPGRYTYDVSGTVTAAGAPRSGSGTATLTVDRPAANRQTTVLDGENGRTETETELRPDGRYLVRLQLTTPGFSKEFVPPSPVLLVPTPPVTGRSWTWTARSTDGATTVTTVNRITGDRTQTVGGTSVATAVVETTLTLRGDVVFDGTTTTDFEPKRGLAVRERSTGRGTARGVAFSSDTRSALRNLDPS